MSWIRMMAGRAADYVVGREEPASH
jgi:hypothetical protein